MSDPTPAKADAAQKARAGWFKVPKALIAWLPYLEKVELGVVHIILFHQNMSESDTAFPGLQTIARILGHRKTKHVSAAITALVNGKLLERVAEGGGRHPSAYRLNSAMDPAQSSLSLPRSKGRKPSPKSGEGKKRQPSPKSGDTKRRIPSPESGVAASPESGRNGPESGVAPSPAAGDRFRPIELDLLKKPEEERLGGTAAAVFSNGEKMGEELRKKAGDSLDEIAATLEMYGVKVTSKTPWVETVFLGIPAAQAIDVISECLRGELTAPIPVRVNLIKAKAPGIIKRIAAREAQKLEQAERTRLEAEQEQEGRRRGIQKLRAELLERFNADQSGILARRAALEAEGLWNAKFARPLIVKRIGFTPEDLEATFGDGLLVLLADGGEAEKQNRADIAAADARRRAEADRLALEARAKADVEAAALRAEQEAVAEKLRERNRWVSRFTPEEFEQVRAAFFTRYPNQKVLHERGSLPDRMLQGIIHEAAIGGQFTVPNFGQQICKKGGANGHQ